MANSTQPDIFQTPDAFRTAFNDLIVVEKVDETPRSDTDSDTHPIAAWGNLQDDIVLRFIEQVSGQARSVRVYGAKGDGATDDTTAIQNAIDATHAAGGGAVFFPVPPGGSYVHGALALEADVRLVYITTADPEGALYGQDGDVAFRVGGATPIYVKGGGASTNGWTDFVSDHGALDGLGDDDHTQYVLANGTRAMASLTVNGNVLCDSASPTITVGDGTGGPVLQLDGATASDKTIRYLHGGVALWNAHTLATSHDWVLNRRNPATGADLGNTIRAFSATGNVSMEAGLQVTGTVSCGGGDGAAVVAGATAIQCGSGTGASGITIFTSATTEGKISCTDVSGTEVGSVGYAHATNEWLFRVSGSTRLRLGFAAFTPGVTGGISLGSTSLRWLEMYADDVIATNNVRTGDGNAGTPSHSFSADANTGMYRVTADTLGFATAGVGRWRIGSTGQLQPEIDSAYPIGSDATRPSAVFSDLVATGGGSAGAPSLYFSSDSDTGLYSWGANAIGIATAGAARWHWDSSGHIVPQTDNTYDIGPGGLRVRTVFAVGLVADRLTLNEQASQTDPSPGDGVYWIRNDAPNTPVFTDDDGNDYDLLAWQVRFAPNDMLGSSSATLGGSNIVFADAAVQNAGFIGVLPEETRPNDSILVEIWIWGDGTATNTANFDVDIARFAAGDNADSFTTSGFSFSGTTISGTAGVITRATATITGVTIGPGDPFFIRIERDGSTDAYAGSVQLIQVRMTRG